MSRFETEKNPTSMEDRSDSTSAPLAGVRVIDLSRLVAGNQLTMLLGDFGAEVIKVERPDHGDTLRHWRIAGQSLYWEVYGRNKKSVTLDLKTDHGKEQLLKLVASANVLVESFRPGTLEKLGLSPAQLHQVNNKLLIVRISGWGQTGDFAHKPGFGTLIEAMSGFAALNGFPDREPVLPPNALADMVAGAYGAFGVLAALRHCEQQGGAGQVMDLSLFEPLFSTLGPLAAAYEATGRVPERSGSRSRTSAPRNVYWTKDERWLAMSCSTQTMAERLFRTIGRPELIEDPRFCDNASRLHHIEDLDQILNAYFGQRTASEILETMEAAGVTIAPVMGIDELMDSALFRSRDVLVRGQGRGGERGVLMPHVVPRLSRTPGTIRSPAPDLGEHNGTYLDDGGS